MGRIEAAEGRAPGDFISDLKDDRTLCQSYKNACIKQEEILKVMTQLLCEQGIVIEYDQDIGKGVDIYLTDTMGKNPSYRNLKLKRMFNDLAACRERSKYFAPILKEIEALDFMFRVRSSNDV